MWCNYCTNKILCNNKECSDCFEKSFASNIKAKFWSNKNKLTPRQVFRNSTASKYWFDCDKCNHDFEQRLDHITGSNVWCPYCTNQKLCNNAECSVCFEKSFASNLKAKFWSNKNTLTPRQVFRGSNNKYWFDCYKCNHEFERPICVIKNDTFCNYCSISTSIICENENCLFCFNKSFASHEKSQFWSDENKLSARQVLKMSGKKYWFDCNRCNNKFEIALYSIVSGSWCPHCVNKTELKLYENILPLFPKLITQFKQDWCKSKTTNRYLRYDFCILDLKIIIELDGPQHFRQISNWSTPEEQFENDIYKVKCANENGYSVIRILQEDVFFDNYDWVKKICETIEEINNRNEIANMYLCKNYEYEQFTI